MNHHKVSLDRARGVRVDVPKAALVAEDEREVRLEAAALLFESAADELELAGAHARRAAEDFRAGEVSRGAAHAWAAFGHLRTGEERLVVQAQEHRQRSLL